jgi:hypothetical protein
VNSPRSNSTEVGSRKDARTLARLVLATLLAMGFFLAQQTAAHATLQLLKENPSDPATFSGHGGYSSDGLGQDGTTGGTVQADVPAGSTVVQAYLYGTYFGEFEPPSLESRTIDFDGTNVELQFLSNSEPGNSDLATARATVTSQVAAKVGSGGGITDFAINTDPDTLDGVALVVIFSNPTLPENTIAVLDGGSKQTGDTATYSFASPIDLSTPGFSATLALGSGFSFQGTSNADNSGDHSCGGEQFSQIDVNGSNLTSCAGNFDDGFGADGALITVGGVGDSTNNPGVEDDELYNLVPFMSTGDTQLVIETANPSSDDNLFLAIISTTAQASVTTEICDNGLDDDGDTFIDDADPDCTPPDGVGTTSARGTDPDATLGTDSVTTAAQYSAITNCDETQSTRPFVVRWTDGGTHTFRKTGAAATSTCVSEGDTSINEGTGTGLVDGSTPATVEWSFVDGSQVPGPDNVNITVVPDTGELLDIAGEPQPLSGSPGGVWVFGTLPWPAGGGA